jgi:hypothetical protein
MRKLNLNFALFSLLTAVGCGQIIGLGDYEIDPSLDPQSKAGTSSQGGQNDAGEGPGGKSGGGSGGTGASPQAAGQGGELIQAGTTNQGGQGGEGGEPPQAGAGGEAGSVGELVPCASALCCSNAGGIAKAVELLKSSSLAGHPYYGDFELGTKADGSPWYEKSTQGYDIVVDNSSGADPRGGLYFAWLGGVADEKGLLESEAFDVPADAGWLTLSGYRKFQIDSDVDDTMNTDNASVSLWTATDAIDAFSIWDQSDPGETTVWMPYEVSIDASPSQGLTLYLDIYAETDTYSTSNIDGSNYMFDDLSLKVFRCYKP